MSAIITAQGVEKSFGARRVLDDVSFGVFAGDRIGLIGVNGSGKSTLMEIVVGGEGGAEPDGGFVTRRRGLRVEYVPQEPQMDPSPSIFEVLKGDGDVPDHEVRGLSSALDLPPLEGPVGALSMGERRRVAIARALVTEADVLALDEPTNHLDTRTVEWLENRLRRRRGTLIVITHDRAFLDRVATRIFEIDRGRLHTYEGGYSAFIQRQAERLAAEKKQEHERARFVERELQWVMRGPKARGTKAKARLDRFEEAAAAAPGEDDRAPGAPVLSLPSGPRLGKKVLEVEGLTRRVGDKALFSGLDLIMKPGDRLGIVGPNGAGKTTLVRTLLGLEPPDAGRVVVGDNTALGYLEQGRGELEDDKTVLEEVARDGEFVDLPSGPVHVRTFLRMLQFPPSAVDTKVGELSGGERNRVQLAALLRKGANFVVLDEPTNDLDLMTLSALEEALAAFSGCALIVSHDRWFLDRVATGIVALEAGGEVRIVEGGYSDYRDHLERATRAEAGRADSGADAPPGRAEAPRARGGTDPARSAPPARERRARKLTFNEKRELAGMEDAIAAAEARVADLEAALSDPEVFKDRGDEVPGYVEELDRARAEVDGLYARWLELEEIAQGSS